MVVVLNIVERFAVSIKPQRIEEGLSPTKEEWACICFVKNRWREASPANIAIC